MSEIAIMLRITDPETVEDYKDVSPEIIYDDLLHGSLMQHTELVGCVVRHDKAEGESK